MQASTEVRGPSGFKGLPSRRTRKPQRRRATGCQPCAGARLWRHEIHKEHRSSRTRVPEGVCGFLENVARRENVETVSVFEEILNGCLDLGYRRAPVIGLVYEVLIGLPSDPEAPQRLA